MISNHTDTKDQWGFTPPPSPQSICKASLSPAFPGRAGPHQGSCTNLSLDKEPNKDLTNFRTTVTRLPRGRKHYSTKDPAKLFYLTSLPHSGIVPHGLQCLLWPGKEIMIILSLYPLQFRRQTFVRAYLPSFRVKR